MLIIEIIKLELIGGHIGNMLIIEIIKLELIGGHIGNMLIIEMAKIELTGGHIGFMLITEIYANYRDGQNRINRRPYWIYLIIEIPK